jgi:hypothetical protein
MKEQRCEICGGSIWRDGYPHSTTAFRMETHPGKIACWDCFQKSNLAVKDLKWESKEWRRKDPYLTCDCDCGEFTSRHILWANQHGRKTRIFCPCCSAYTDVTEKVEGNSWVDVEIKHGNIPGRPWNQRDSWRVYRA